MAAIVQEIMNRELLSLRVDERAEDAREYIRTLGVHAAPVLDAAGMPIGMLSISDLLGNVKNDSVEDRMSTPIIGVRQDEEIDTAARTFARTGFHHMVVVDAAGKAVGFLSVLDVMRAMLGLPAQKPTTFPHYDEPTGLVWTDDTEMTEAGVQVAPAGPGLLVLVKTVPERVDAIVWAEVSDDVRARLLAMIEGASSPVAQDLASGKLRFRAASAPDEATREAAFAALGDVIISGGPLPG